MAWYDKYFSGNADKKTDTPPSRRGGAGGNSTKKNTPKPAPKPKPKPKPKPAPKPKPKPAPKPKPTKIEEKDVGYSAGQVDPKLAAAVNKQVETPKPAPKLPDNSLGGPTEKPTGSKVYNLAGDLVEDTLTKTAPKLTIPDKKVETLTRQEKLLEPKVTSKLAIPTDKIGYDVGQVDPKLAQAVNTSAPKLTIPDKKVETLTRQEEKLDPTPVAKTVTKPRLQGGGVKDGPMFVRKEGGSSTSKPETRGPNSGRSFWDRLGTASDAVGYDVGQVDPKLAEAVNIKADAPAEVPKYNQDYWADQVAKGVSQANIIAEQNSLGIKKAYSGDQVVTKANSDTANFKLKKITGSDATLQNGGVTKATETSGLAGENFTTTYDYTNGPKIVQKGTDPVVAGVRLGDKTSTTYVDGVEVATKTGHDPLGRDAVVTKPTIAGHITDTTKVQEPYTAPFIDTPSSVTAGAGSRGSTTSAAPTYGEEITPDKEKAISRRAKRKGKNALKIRRDKALNFTGSGTGLNIPR